MAEGFDRVPDPLREALVARGFTALTAVQESVLDSADEDRDLRISSQTGSGKTIAVGIVLHPMLVSQERDEEDEREGCRPSAIMIAPTRELATQVAKELGWLYAPAKHRVVSVTGGTSFGAELRSLRRGADVIVGTPGRLLDHLDRGTIDPRSVQAVVLDEADQMLDLGFREELEGILKKLPDERRTHLVSATFSREVMGLADRYQRAATSVQGTRLGAANVDIRHVVHVIAPAQRDDVVVNLLLASLDDPTLVFVRTRVDGAELGEKLARLGFAAAALTGDMEQRERTRVLDAFRKGTLRVLVATDVAARGIDVVDVAQVIHADPPGDADVYTHRSGRTGRAGRKGTSVLLVPPVGQEHAARILRRARIEPTFRPAPTAAEIHLLLDARFVSEIEAPEATQADPRVVKLADALLEKIDPRTLVTKLLRRSPLGGPCAPREVAAIAPRPVRQQAPPPQRRPVSRKPQSNAALVPFRVTWGARHGADPRRLLALVCRRGNIHSKNVGAIDVGPHESIVEIASEVAAEFGRLAKQPDARDRRVRIEPLYAKTE